MKKTILDLTPKELSERATQASRKAVDRLLKAGILVKTKDGQVTLKESRKQR